ncbi:hypothetical protein L0B53_16170 [Vibrio sp. SS-MA-C1-2]|uniref:hypothetical protein n=1 Tax=Vibrio sp. SS-MA-C1-2 TaxID=2908646 RepID=UPI001F4642D6|nr:hypothetical protein [Vibrio sp. SS-MA-C1-2]UJF18536.1 hypothetical protein L0B53_16170 [Vibrio sp. SS-MA-C1-2]
MHANTPSLSVVDQAESAPETTILSNAETGSVSNTKIAYSTLLQALDTNAIYEYAHKNSNESPTIEGLSWVLKHWPIEQTSDREITKDTLLQLKASWKHYASKLKSEFNTALNAILRYLNEVLDWRLPQEEKKRLIDHDAQHIQRLHEDVLTPHRLIEQYQQQLTTFYHDRTPLSSEWVAVIVAMEVAPLPVTYLLQILNNPSCIENNGTQTTLRLEHPQQQSLATSSERVAFTRYQLPLLAFRALNDHHIATQKKRSVNHDVFLSRLTTLINSMLIPLGPFDPQYSVQTDNEVHHLLQAVWLCREQRLPTLLRDIAYPQRHVAIDIELPSETDKQRALKTIYTQNWCEPNVTELATPKKVKWEYKQLMTRAFKTRSRQIKYHVDKWEAENILPQMACLYVRNLVLYGGQRKHRLAEGTIYTYTSSLQPLLTDFPLSFDASQNHLALMKWALNVYENTEQSESKHHLLRFFKFLSTQDLTDNIDLSGLGNPVSMTHVDAGLIEIEQLDEIVDALLSNKEGQFFQRLFSASAVILSYFGCLRRGEATRLRIKDIQQQTEQRFELYITHTGEGKTKDGHSRSVHLYLPARFASLIRMCIKIKPKLAKKIGRKNCSSQTPLLGFEDESFSSRQRYYLLPATRAIKAVCGAQCRFHHLRHSGAFLSYLQHLTLAYDLESDVLPISEGFKSMLQKKCWIQNLTTGLRGYHLLRRMVIFYLMNLSEKSVISILPQHANTIYMASSGSTRFIVSTIMRQSHVSTHGLN